MWNEGTRSTIQQLVRIVAYFGSGFLIKYGIDQDEFITQVAGGVIALGNLGWWVYWQFTRRPD